MSESRSLIQLAYLLALVVFLPIAASAQTPIKVELCDLVKEPQKYNRQWVEVRGAMEMGFENFTLRSDQCEGEHRLIWLMYGGGTSAPVAVSLQRDAGLEEFKSRLHAGRMRAPDGVRLRGAVPPVPRDRCLYRGVPGSAA
jgi:hypothetical protein